jgi:hypothetical protein
MRFRRNGGQGHSGLTRALQDAPRAGCAVPRELLPTAQLPEDEQETIPEYDYWAAGQ